MLRPSPVTTRVVFDEKLLLSRIQTLQSCLQSVVTLRGSETAQHHDA
jgi:hypothetical protein